MSTPPGAGQVNLAALEGKLSGLLEAAPDAMIIADRDGRIVMINSQAERLFGYPRQELAGRRIEELVPERFRAAHPGHRERYVGEPRSRPMGSGLRLQGRRKDATEFPVEISLSPIETADGMLVIAAVRDVTEQRALHEQLGEQHRLLSEQYRRLQEAGRLKTEFLANMSHELRTPLHAIIGFSELMHDGKVGPMSPDQREYVGDILSSGRHLLRLINDVLDLARIDAGRMEFHPEPVDAAELVRDVCAVVKTEVTRRRLRIETAIDPALGPLVVDPARLKQVLHHFLSNAIKFTPEGQCIRIRLGPDGDETFRLEVEDTGIGIPEAALGRLFIEFEQLDPGTGKRFQGTGVGLALIKRIVTAQGGRVGVTSTPGVGSTFFALLPRTPGGAPADPTRAPGPGA